MGVAIVTGDIGLRLCEALGLEPAQVVNLRFDVAAGNLVTVEATLLADTPLVDVLATEVQRYELHPIEDE